MSGGSFYSRICPLGGTHREYVHLKASDVICATLRRRARVQAEAERESRAILIKANAELQASSKLAAAAKNMQDPNAMQLRILSTVNDVSKDQSNTIILALPLETLKAAGIQGVASLSAIGTKKNTN